MKYILFYAIVAVILAAFIAVLIFKRPDLRHYVIVVSSIAYAFAFDVIFGLWAKLYYYLDYSNNALYIALSAIFLYTALNMVYVIFLPKKKVALYTIVWIAAMLAFEYFTVITEIIVFTGWKPIPWSPLTYIVTYIWIYYFYRYLSRRISHPYCD